MGEAFDEPEGADCERRLLAGEAVDAVGDIAVDETVGGELVRDAIGRRPSPRIVVRDEPDDRDHQVRRVQRLGPEGLHERAGLGIDALGVDELPDLVSRGAPGFDVALATILLGQFDDAIERHPGHHLRIDEMPGLAADLPDSLIGLAPLVQHPTRDPAEEVPEDVVDLAAVPPVEIGRIEQLAKDVELELLRGAVADAHRP